MVSLRRFFIFHFAMYVCQFLKTGARFYFASASSHEVKKCMSVLGTGARFYFASAKLQIKTKLAIKI